MAGAIDRSDPTVAQATLQRLVPGDEERALVLRALGEVAAAAGAVNPGSWSITLSPHQISLNVGSIVILRVGQDGLEFSADEPLLARVRATVTVGEPTFEFKIVAGVRFYRLPIELDNLQGILDALVATEFALVRRAAESDGPWRRAHSPAVVQMLERTRGQALAWRAPSGMSDDASGRVLPGWIVRTERAEGLASGVDDDRLRFRGSAAGATPAFGEQVFLFDGAAQRLWGVGVAVPGDASSVAIRVTTRLDPPLAADVIRQHPDLADLDLNDIKRSEVPFVALTPRVAESIDELARKQRAPRIVKIAVSNDYDVSWDECLSRREIRVGWDRVGDLRQFASKQQFKRVFGEQYGSEYNQSPGTIGRKANELWTLRELQPGDRVVANRGISEVLAVGVVMPEAYVFDDARPEFKHTVRVEWDTSVGGRIQKQPYWGFTTVDDVSPELYASIVSGEAEAVSPANAVPTAPDEPLATPAVAVSSLAPDATPPASADPGVPASADPEVSEGPTISAELLAQTIFNRDDLVFSPDTISAFMLALQTRRFVILSGISGTGKTQFARAFAETAARLLGTPHNLAIVPVRPDWTDHRGLLGCENVISSKYMATDAVRLIQDANAEMVRAAAERRAPAPFFLVLDEMNLARVEHYLADILSVMESGQPLGLHDHPEPLHGVPPRLAFPRNVCLIGTVNVDETTYMFSPKVLDRAFVLELSHVDLLSFGARPVIPGPDDLLLREAPLSLVALGRTAVRDWEQFGRMRQGGLRRMVTDLHRLLQDDGRGFGYRVAGELARFVALAEEFGCPSDSELTGALDLAILMKVLPRLHGAQQELERPLCRLLDFACTGSDGRAGDESLDRWRVDAGRLVAQTDGAPARLPRSAAKLHRMLTRLRQRGFVAYIE